MLVVTDGHAGLKKALTAWPTVRVQRSTAHKWRDLEDACPVHARPELKRDYHLIVHAADGLAAPAAEREGSLAPITVACYFAPLWGVPIAAVAIQASTVAFVLWMWRFGQAATRGPLVELPAKR